jgi:large subunit ribosomal protein L9
MELILLQKVVNLGNLGDKVKVKPGYGRNYLVPQGKAVPATAANVATFEAKRAEYEAKAKALTDGAEARRLELDGVSVTLKANASTEGKLYGSVGPRDIAEALTAAGHKVNKSEVVMGEGPLRHIGEFEVLVHLHADVEVPVKVNRKRRKPPASRSFTRAGALRAPVSFCADRFPAS